MPDTGDRAAPDPAGAVAAFLRANPQFLALRPELYHLLAPPARIHGEALADHMAAMLAAARSTAAQLLTAQRATAGMQARVQEAVLALFGAEDVGETVVAAFPKLLGVDAARLCGDLPPGGVESLLGGRDVLIRAGHSDTAPLHAEAARLAGHEALVRLPGRAAVLSLAARDKHALDPAQASAPLAFLGRALAAALPR